VQLHAAIVIGLGRFRSLKVRSPALMPLPKAAARV
jgi:hypothetical protein